MSNFRDGSVAQIVDDIKKYGQDRYAAGKSAAYLSVYKMACEKLAQAEQSEYPLYVFTTFVDDLEQVKSIINDGR